MAERVTLITGASTGIGVELARIFAANDHRVVLVARRADRLSALADEIVNGGGAPPIVIACDLERADSCDIIAGALAAQNVEVEFVVNNAGFGLLGDACTLDRGQQIGMIDVNVRALTDLSLRFSDSIIRHGGGILNVASIAGYLPGPCMAVYYASKAYVLSFTEALHQELRPKGVRVTALCPGPVPTEFQGRAGVQPGFDSRLLNMSATKVALAGYRGLMAGKRVVLPGFAMKIIPLLLRLAPRPIVLGAASRIQSKR
ncbi:SDR family oxidoreductase [Bradyrhizobium sp. U87765 SZCCT0131]|uniref:SDR family NAD(P)-dependent oxidoreductase n=1 Tax=unclassified Bradyrhizobium TaxID=2631580 RepID=UPI001BACC571|nr:MULTISPECIES: SDR family oxidoreductase [unclassified Bradyrhizobium]MBR1216921.1 SDR family oxidoreductase [Bradyrhizobium sp. U87765 SZCCT0131]MBR1259323.1 SDR family oxidoreductase [Bradyrhizobium sp. U87765 SZCCT0134]MBR1305464.1 SDR family oxidoreductase [Bradyrhizobium sp. U87765 SZCCT0110]MBR1321831.1 SDR family oxidoreductase [Bradyrhizobium sp. U87765 SZCCT0109]MBR1350891.1 SDR family oxidoreductase [Bradyrhizobium sp. U87765 SZCCT0048]